MIEALLWSISFVVMVFVLGGSALLSVRMVEKGKTDRLAEVEKTKRQGMDNAFQLEQERLTIPALGTGMRSPNQLREISFDLPGGDDEWK